MDQNIIRVLLIEDDEDDYLIIRDLLSDIKDTYINLDWVTREDSVLQSMGENQHDIYLVDYFLGLCTGLELMQEAIAQGCIKPIIILTGQDNREIDLAVMEAGAADYLVKGQFDSQLLERSIRFTFERAKLLDKLNALTIKDELTGLYNRREMNRLLEYEFERHWRHGYPLSLIMADIDHFKHVNDYFGHPVGDQILRWLADIIRRDLRTLDRPCRYGGEEFAIILPETSVQYACQVAERLRQTIAAQSYWYEGNETCQGQNIPITISLGVAEIPGDADEITSLIQAVDQALYSAKHNGRNRTVSFHLIGSRLRGEQK